MDDSIPILEWVKKKIELNDKEYKRKITHKRNKQDGAPRAVKRGEVYGATLGRNIGSEQNGRSRPVIIIQETTYSQESPTILVAPLTASHDKYGNTKRVLPTHILFSHEKLDKESIIKLEHIRSISKNRLNAILCYSKDTEKIMPEIDKKLSLVFGIKKS